MAHESKPPPPPRPPLFAPPPPPTEPPRFAMPDGEALPAQAIPEAPITAPPPLLRLTLLICFLLALIQMVIGSGQPFLFPGWHVAQLFYTALVAYACHEGRPYGLPLAIFSLLMWSIAAIFAIEGRAPVWTPFELEERSPSALSSPMRAMAFFRLITELVLSVTLLSSPSRKYFQFRREVDRFGGRAWRE
ncbi:MAG: hypothetical protein NZM37_04730 [Sandaracinaceae bacterium]|nr:hypothetical protein [Sandaracinaceae bacterium]